MATKRASYREAVDWIAQNDSAADHDADDPEVVAYLVTSVLVADLWDKDPIKVGHDVVHRRFHLGIVDSIVAHLP